MKINKFSNQMIQEDFEVFMIQKMNNFIVVFAEFFYNPIKAGTILYKCSSRKKKKKKYMKEVSESGRDWRLIMNIDADLWNLASTHYEDRQKNLAAKHLHIHHTLLLAVFLAP